jgi:hypothetical protein
MKYIDVQEMCDDLIRKLAYLSERFTQVCMMMLVAISVNYHEQQLI